MKRIWPFLPALLLAGSAAFGAEATCSTTTGAPPIQTKAPVTVRPVCVQGQLLSFDQDGVTRYACLNLPQGARQRAGGTNRTKWPLRNLCDAAVSCATTSAWIDTLSGLSWPYQAYNLGLTGRIVSAHQSCAASCSEIQGIYEHVRWPNTNALQTMLDFLRKHPLPAGSGGSS